MISDATMDSLRSALALRGTPSALALLNSLTDLRYTSLYRFDGPSLCAVTFYDRTTPNAEIPDDIPVEVSYCVFIRDTNRPFLLEDSLHDLRVASHPKCRVIRSYYGVPVVNRDGVTTGTLCHFDENPKPVTPELIELTESVARLLGEARA
jgi:GAF domain-containing protein